MIGLDDLDNKVLKLLGKKPIHTSEISRELKVLRTTIQYRLNRLALAKLVEKTKKGIRSIWRPIYKNPHNKSYFQIYKGDNIIDAYKQLLLLPRHTIILSAQGSGAAQSEFNALPDIFIRDAHRIFKRKGIIMKGVFNEKALGLFNNLDKTMIESHIGRTQSVRAFSGEKFVSSGELMSTEKFLLLADPKHGFAIIIKEKEITKIVNDTLQTLFELLSKEKVFDLNFYLKTKIAKK